MSSDEPMTEPETNQPQPTMTGLSAQQRTDVVEAVEAAAAYTPRGFDPRSYTVDCHAAADEPREWRLQGCEHPVQRLDWEQPDAAKKRAFGAKLDRAQAAAVAIMITAWRVITTNPEMVGLLHDPHERAHLNNAINDYGAIALRQTSANPNAATTIALFRRLDAEADARTDTSAWTNPATLSRIAEHFYNGNHGHTRPTQWYADLEEQQHAAKAAAEQKRRDEIEQAAIEAQEAADEQVAAWEILQDANRQQHAFEQAQKAAETARQRLEQLQNQSTP